MTILRSRSELTGKSPAARRRLSVGMVCAPARTCDPCRRHVELGAAKRIRRRSRLQRSRPPQVRVLYRPPIKMTRLRSCLFLLVPLDHLTAEMNGPGHLLLPLRGNSPCSAWHLAADQSSGLRLFVCSRRNPGRPAWGGSFYASSIPSRMRTAGRRSGLLR